MKTRRTLQVSNQDFLEKLEQFVEFEHEFYSHPHNIKKPFYGKIINQSFKIKNTPSILYNDSIILIKGKIQNEILEFSTQINNLILIIFFTSIFIGTLITLYILENDLVKIPLVLLIILVPYITVPYLINKNKFKKIVNEINYKEG